MTVFDQILSKWLVVIRAGLHTKEHMCEAVLRLQDIRLEAELLEALFGVVKDQPVQKDLPCRGAEKGVVALFGDVHAYHQMLHRSTDLTLQLTKLLQSAIIVLVHRNLLA